MMAEAYVPACLLEVFMPESGGSPKHVPYGADQTSYLVVDSFNTTGTGYRETEIERTDFETIVADFLTGQFNDPVRVIAFNTLEHWSDDVSEAIATEIQTRCDIEGVSVPEHISDFVDRATGARIANSRSPGRLTIRRARPKRPHQRRKHAELSNAWPRRARPETRDCIRRRKD